MKKKLRLIFTAMLLFALPVMAQQVLVSGKVTSTDGPFAGASVKIRGGQAVQTNNVGTYSIKALKTDILEFSYLGLSSKNKLVGDNIRIDMFLDSDAQGLDEVVVTAFGITREKKQLGYSAQTIKGEEIAGTQRDNFLNALQGRVAGATITPTTGTPGASSQIIIRGAVSLDGDNQPLFVVDGLPISNRTFNERNLVGEGTGNRNNDYGNRAMDLNPEEIESLTILKGPEAAALYGTEGASGAVVITTRRAKSGKAKVTYNNNFRVDNVYRFPDVQKVYGNGLGGFEDDNIRSYFGPVYKASDVFYDNFDAFYKTGFTQRHNASIEGGTDALSLRTNLSYTDQEGTVPNTAYNTLNLKITGTSKISDKVKMNGSLNLINSRTDKVFKGAAGPMLSVLSWPLTDDITNYLKPNGDRRTINPTGFTVAELDNPFFSANKNRNFDKVSRVLGNFGVDYSPTKWLNLAARGGVDIAASQGLSAFHPQAFGFSTANVAAGGQINTYSDNSRLYNGTFIATLKKDFGKFKPMLTVGTDISNRRTEINSQFGSRFFKADFYSLNNVDPTTQRVLSADELIRKVGVFGNAVLGYDTFLYLTLTGRYDQSSTLPVANQGFFYPAVSLAFVFSELAPLKKLDWLSYGKLRSSWGQTGKDARLPYITNNRLGAQTSSGGGFATGVTAGNPNLVAEFTTAQEVGLEMGFFKNRLSFDFTYFQTLSDKQITAPRLSYGTGAILAYINSGKIRYRGFEVLLKGTPIKTKDFSWDISANAGRQRGLLLSLPGDQSVFYLADTWLADNVRKQFIVGGSASAFAGTKNLRNAAGQLLINPTNGLPIKDALFTPIGDTAPDFAVGLTNSFTYKNFNLSFLLDMRKGGDIYNATEQYLYARGLSKLSLDRETPRIITGVLRDGLENSANPTVNNIIVTPYITTSYYTQFYNSEDFLQKDVGWVRLKDITLSYNLPKKLFTNSKVLKSANVFATGTDLLLITNYQGVDPSVNGLTAAAGGLGGSGIDFGSVGLPRGYNFGLRIGF